MPLDIRISFDDCNLGDLRAAKLLKQYGFTATFYMPSTGVRGTQLMTLKEVKEGILDLGHEIGGHTVSHPMDMKACSNEQLKFECENNRFLCQLLSYRAGRGDVTKFCYPRGRHDERVRAAVKAAGYLEARTTRVLKIENDTGDPFQTPTTIHMFAREEYEGQDWLELAKRYFNSAMELHSQGREGTFFSLWGHTKELTEHADWGRFEELLKYMRQVVDKSHVANGANAI